MKNTFLRLFAGIVVASPLFAQDAPVAPEEPVAPAEPVAETDPAVIKSDSSYGFGYNNGQQFKRMMSQFGLTAEDIDTDRFIAGFMDAIAEKEAEGGQEKLNAAMLGLRNILQEREQKVAAENLEKAKAFLAENKEREGIKTTESGLQYEVLEEGEGDVYDGTQNARFLVNYKGTLIDGTEFDASPEGQPVPMTLSVVPGFKEALTTMPVGAKWKIYLSPELAYGEQRRSDLIEPNSVLIFELELVEIQKPAPKPKAVSPPIQIPPAPEKAPENATEKAAE
ncbi:MAG: FKBP-type peptidyl-prolyl cis-trans isomerase [Verrucomicrobiota bacterium JB023]|nr:FKBP-type peptidyl-prolyl cis-trans isomerase [Verrucomicrobiota bacterium JB023]